MNDIIMLDDDYISKNKLDVTSLFHYKRQIIVDRQITNTLENI